MLDEHQLAAGPEHTPQLSQCARLVAHPAEHQGRDRRVERVVLERKVLRGGLQNVRQRRLLAYAPLQPANIGGSGSVTVSDSTAGP